MGAPPSDATPHPGRIQAPVWHWQDALTPAELKELLRVPPWGAIRSLLTNWGLIAASLALVAWFPHPVTVLGALFVIGARQLGLSILMHEAAHGTLFANPRMNDGVGQWLAAYPVWSDLVPYRRYHLLHHAHTGHREDPDLPLTAPFPITRKSLARKVLRDLCGITGLKQTRAVLERDLGFTERATQRNRGLRPGERPDTGWHKLVPVALTNGVLLGAMALAGHPELYLLWVVAWLTTYRLCMRIRSIAEHALTPDIRSPFGNTRTTRASAWERLLIAPNFVNYHLEHHLLMKVPHSKLPRLHALLRERGVLEDACVAPGYLHVLARASSRPA